MARLRLPTMNSICRYWNDWKPEDCPSAERNSVYSDGVMVRSTSQAEFSCSKMRATRASILNAGGRVPAAIASRAAAISWIASRIQSSEVWCWMMNSISSCAPLSGFCAPRIRSTCR